MHIGYARVSTDEQTLDLQIDALKAAGCERIFTDKASGMKQDRPGLARAFEEMRPGDVFVVWRLDRLGRSLSDLVQWIARLRDSGQEFRSLSERLETISPSGRLQFHVFSALAEFERELIKDRTAAGLAAARARGRHGGRPRSMTPAKIKMAATLMADPSTAVATICETLDISRSTLYRYVNPDGTIKQKGK